MNNIDILLHKLRFTVLLKISKILQLRVSQIEIFNASRDQNLDKSIHDLEQISKNRNLIIYKLFYNSKL